MKAGSLMRTLALILLLGYALAPSASAFAQDDGFIETFDDANLPGWELTPNLSVTEGYLIITGEGYAFLPESRADAVIGLRLKMEGDGVIEIRYRISEEGMYILRLTPRGMELLKDAGGTETSLAMVQAFNIFWEWRRIEITLSGSGQRIRVDSGIDLTVDEEAPLPSGGLMLHVLGEATGLFDEVTLLPEGELEGTEPSAEAATAMGTPTRSPTPEASPGQGSGWPGGISCGGALALPLGFVGTAWLRRTWRAKVAHDP